MLLNCDFNYPVEQVRNDLRPVLAPVTGELLICERQCDEDAIFSCPFDENWTEEQAILLADKIHQGRNVEHSI